MSHRTTVRRSPNGRGRSPATTVGERRRGTSRQPLVRDSSDAVALQRSAGNQAVVQLLAVQRITPTEKAQKKAAKWIVENRPNEGETIAAYLLRAKEYLGDTDFDHLTEVKARAASLLAWPDGFAATTKGFDKNDKSTWKKINPLTYHKVAAYELAGEDVVVNKIAACEQKGNTREGGEAEVGANQTGHCHILGGSGGVSFLYRLEADNSITPIIYDIAWKRLDNDYKWVHWKKTTAETSKALP